MLSASLNKTFLSLPWQILELLSLCFQSRVDQAEEYVDQHQQYQDQYQQCRDWMTTTKDRLVICAEVTSDKQALQNRMDRAQVSTPWNYLEYT